MHTNDKPDLSATDAESAGFASRMEHLVAACGGVAALAHKSDVSPAAVRKWKSDRSQPTVDRLVRLAASAGVSVGWLATGLGKPEPPETDERLRRTLSYEAVEAAVGHAERWRRRHPDYRPDPDHLARIIRVVAEEIQDRGAPRAADIVEQLLAMAWPAEV